MFVELIEALRCPRGHAESPLVVTASRTDARHIVEGTLGCPVCHAEFAIRNGEALFSEDAPVPDDTPDAEAAMRLAASLELTDPRGYALLCGRWGAQATGVRALCATPLLLVNPPRGVDVMSSGIVRVRAGRVPVANASARAAALDAGEDVLTASVVAAVRPGGRVVGPASLAPPAGVSELARDAGMWVGERRAAPEDPAPRLVPLRRA